MLHNGGGAPTLRVGRWVAWQIAWLGTSVNTDGRSINSIILVIAALLDQHHCPTRLLMCSGCDTPLAVRCMECILCEVPCAWRSAEGRIGGCGGLSLHFTWSTATAGRAHVAAIKGAECALSPRCAAPHWACIQPASLRKAPHATGMHWAAASQ